MKYSQPSQTLPIQYIKFYVQSVNPTLKSDLRTCDGDSFVEGRVWLFSPLGTLIPYYFNLLCLSTL